MKWIFDTKWISGQLLQKSDERISGNEGFFNQALSQSREQMERRHKVRAQSFHRQSASISTH